MSQQEPDSQFSLSTSSQAPARRISPKKLWQKHRTLILMVLLPWCLAAFYYGVLASDRYVSSASFMIQGNDSNQTLAISPLAALGLPSEQQDERLLEAYIQSHDMLLKLQEHIELQDHYQQETADALSRLKHNASLEDFFDFYLAHTKVHYNEIQGLLTVEAQAFEPEYSQTIVQNLLNNSEAFLNSVGQQLAQSQQAFVLKEVSHAETQLKSSKEALIRFQNQSSLASPEAQGSALSNILAELQAQLIQAKTQRLQLLAFQHPDSPQIVAIEQQITALETQINDENQHLVGDEQQTLNRLNAEYQSLLLDIEFKTQAYQATLAALENARAEASRKLKHLVVITSPTLAEEARYPRVLYNLSTLFIVLLLIYGVSTLTLKTIREHQD